MSNRRVVVGMSGGVDSSTTAALLKQQGYDVVGVGLRFPMLQAGCGSERSCCGIAGMEDARRVAARLDIPFYVLDYEQIFRDTVIEYFFDAYRRGRTPNPCVACNRLIKFGHLLRVARGMGAEAVGTGHYAQIIPDAATGRKLLRRGADPEKDQSYFLYSLSQEQLAQALFPLGGMTKIQTRELARSFDLPVAEKPGSQDICFLGDGDYRALLAERSPDAFRPGPIVDRQGKVLGQHPGAAGFTIGQRKGIGIAAREPLFVIAISVETHTVVVGTKEELLTDRIHVGDLNWIAWDQPPERAQMGVKVRYRQADRPATLYPGTDGTVEVRFETPLERPAAGQSAVFYQGDTIVGGGVIV